MKEPVHIFVVALLLLAACNRPENKQMDKVVVSANEKPSQYSNTDTSAINLSNAEWSKLLPKDMYQVARQKGTERAFSGKYNNHKETGSYYCAVCGNPVFNSNGKFESSCGWPSFFEPVSKTSIIYAPDTTHGMQRTEITCGRCKSHLGHVFNDGPPPTGLRYCINSVVLDFKKAKGAEKNFKDAAIRKN